MPFDAATRTAPSDRPRTKQGKYNTYKPSQIIARGPRAGLPKRSKPDPARHLTPRQIRELLNAEALAEHLGIGFAVHITILWQCSPDFTTAAWPQRLRRFVDKLHRWLDRRGIPIAVAWLNENGRRYGNHSHFLLHLPHPKRGAVQSFNTLKADLTVWIVATENLAIDRVDHRGKSWRPVRITGGSFGMRTRRMRSGVCRYWLKGMNPKDVFYTGFGAESRAAILGIRTRASILPASVQRCGTSRSLGPQARREAGWRELISLEDFHARLNPT
jgi:hypothetical protein